MAGLGAPGLFFIPILLRLLDHQVMASILIYQVYVYYLIILVNFGLDWSAPAEYGQATNEADASQAWANSLRSKISIMVFMAMPMFFIGYAFFNIEGFYLIALLGLLVATALNSNWILNSKENFYVGVSYVYGGVLVSVALLFLLMNLNVKENREVAGLVAVLIMISPQFLLGVGTWLNAKRMINLKDFRPADAKIFDFSALKVNYLLVATQLMQLMSATLGTLVVGVFTDAETVTAYGALEKIFNLAVSVLVALYMVRYPRYAALFQNDRRLYWGSVMTTLGTYFTCGFIAALMLLSYGQEIGRFYLTDTLAEKVSSVFLAFTLWLSLCIGQNLLTGYYIFSKKIRMTFFVNFVILLVTCSVGYASVVGLQPIMWVIGLIAGQVVALTWLGVLFYFDRRDLSSFL